MSTIQRTKRRRADNFTIVGNDATRDERLSFRARGLLTYLMGHEPGWRITLITLAKQSPTEGVDAIRTAIKELREFGYVKMTRERLATGRMGSTIWEVSDDPSDLVDEEEEVDQSNVGPPEVDDPIVVDSPEVDDPNVAQPNLVHPHALRRQSSKKINTQENHVNGAPPATENQREYLRDLHLHGGGRSPDEIETWISGLTAAEADDEIKDALRVLPRGRQYAGDRENPGLSPKGRDVAAARMIPPRKEP